MPLSDRQDGSIFYVKRDTTSLLALSKPDPAKRPKDPLRTELLWGDRVRLLRDDQGRFITKHGRHRAKSRSQTGWIQKSHLGRKPLLELYFIDVGQGDGVLLVTPNRRHVLIDGGWPRKSQPTGKNASDFVDWKFVRDYESPSKAIELDAIICSHNDQDHYGGLWDLLDPGQLSTPGTRGELDARSVSVERFYHAGLSWWNPSNRTLGTPVQTSVGKLYTQLLGDRQSLVDGLKANARPKLQGEWSQFLRKVRAAETSAGNRTPVQRLSDATGVLPGFDGTSAAASQVPEPTIHVLAPVEFDVGGKPAIRHFPDGDSKNTNGNSVLLRVDCGDARILLTGDLNTHSQDSLLKDYAGNESVFESDVAKACHHGSGDVSFGFLQEIAPLVTIISSGDSEGHDHPKPEIIAASATSGTQTLANDKLVTPLIYSTELARSVELGLIERVHEDEGDGAEIDISDLEAFTKVTKAGDRAPSTVRRGLERARIATKTVYGLINVRTDGKKILCAALNEKSSTWNWQVVKPKSR